MEDTDREIGVFFLVGDRSFFGDIVGNVIWVFFWVWGRGVFCY